METSEREILFKQFNSLTEISEEAFEKIFQIAEKRCYTKGQNVLSEGKVCRHVLFVMSGYLRTYTNTESKEINTNFTFEGNFAADVKSLSSGAVSAVNIQAAEPATLYQFNRDLLLELYTSSPEIAAFGRKVLELLFSAAEEHSTLFKINSPAERYNYLLIQQPEMLQRVSLSQLSSYLGVARETLSRIRKNKVP